MIDKIKYTLEELATNYDDRDWWHQRLESRVAGPLLGLIHGTDGVNVMEENWDNLLILDAARADMFESVLGTSQFDNFDTKQSVGCASPEWMENTFKEKEFPDTVFVSGNPWISKIAPDSFHHISNLWTEEFGVSERELREADLLRDVDLDSETVLAEDLTDAALKIQDDYPNKRIIVHYFQPHAPCVGLSDGSLKDEVDHDVHPGTAMKNGIVKKRTVWNAYEENLGYGFHHANRFAEQVGGKSVFTADHGELFGEWLWPLPLRGYAHPVGVWHPKLTTVPWAEKTVGSRRKITDGRIESHSANEEQIDDHLRDLGYRV